MRILHAPEPDFLSEGQRALLTAIFEALLPGSASAPGATDAGAVDYLDSLLTRDPASYYEVQGWRDLYTAGLGALADVDEDDITALLGQLQRGELSGLPAELDQKRLFTTMRNHCIEGCFADPRWRGNSDAVMWRWLGSHGPAEDFERERAEVSHGV
jgi:gluconate 2-dehydrogenase gamma chain